MLDLPDELLLHIFSYCPNETLLAINHVNSLWRKLTDDTNVWKSLVQKYYFERITGIDTSNFTTKDWKKLLCTFIKRKRQKSRMLLELEKIKPKNLEITIVEFESLHEFFNDIIETYPKYFYEDPTFHFDLMLREEDAKITGKTKRELLDQVKEISFQKFMKYGLAFDAQYGCGPFLAQLLTITCEDLFDEMAGVHRFSWSILEENEVREFCRRYGNERIEELFLKIFDKQQMGTFIKVDTVDSLMNIEGKANGFVAIAWDCAAFVWRRPKKLK